MKKNMCTVVWRDMLVQVKNYKWFEKKTDNGSPTGFWLFYLFFILPVVWNVFQEKKAAVIYFSCVCVLVLSMLLGRICPMRLSKIMYLCPMTAEERRQYLVISYVTKVLIGVLLSCIVEAIPFALGYVTWYSAVMAVFSVVMLAMGVNMAGGDRAFHPSDFKNRALKRRCYGYNGWMIGQQIYAVIYCIAMFVWQFTGAIVGEEKMSRIGIVLCLIFSAINLLLTLILLTFFKGTTEVIMNYEMVYETDRTRRSRA